jgi:hypothetical protein
LRFWFSGPRIFGHRTGISFGPEDFRRLQSASASAPATSRRPSAFVYVIRKAIQGHVKVGIGADPRERLRTLQTGSSEPLELVYTCAVKSNDGLRVERAAQDMMRNHQLVGEWFDTTPEMAVAAIAASAHHLGDPIVEIPPDKINAVLTIAAMQDAAAQPRSSFGRQVAVAFATIFGLSVCFAVAVVYVMNR